MAIGIIAFAFVSLMGLLPTGLTVYRASIDAGNETWILQSLNSMVQVTDWSKIDALNYADSHEVYYYDEQGRQTDTENNPGQDDAKNARLYGAKLLVERLYEPGKDGELEHARRVVALIVNVTQPRSREAFDAITTTDGLSNLPAGVEVHSKAFITTRMDSAYTAVR